MSFFGGIQKSTFAETTENNIDRAYRKNEDEPNSSKRNIAKPRDCHQRMDDFIKIQSTWTQANKLEEDAKYLVHIREH
jgi:hypothetical protein